MTSRPAAQALPSTPHVKALAAGLRTGKCYPITYPNASLITSPLDSCTISVSIKMACSDGATPELRNYRTQYSYVYLYLRNFGIFSLVSLSARNFSHNPSRMSTEEGRPDTVASRFRPDPCSVSHVACAQSFVFRREWIRRFPGFSICPMD